MIREYKIEITQEQYKILQGVKLNISPSVDTDFESSETLVTFFGTCKADLTQLSKELSKNHIKSKVSIL